jgi:hypothetical protein
VVMPTGGERRAGQSSAFVSKPQRRQVILAIQVPCDRPVIEINLGDVSDALLAYENGEKDPFT